MKIVKYPHPALRTMAQPVTAIDGEIQAAAARMFDLMATRAQSRRSSIALPVRLLVLISGDREEESEFVAINPVVESKGSISDRGPEHPGPSSPPRTVSTTYNLKVNLRDALPDRPV